MPEHKLPRLLQLRLGESDTPLELDGLEDTRLALELLSAQARQELLIHSRELDARLLDRRPFLEAVERLCRAHREARVRILVRDPQAAVRRGHRLLELGRRLSSHIEFRQPQAEHRQYNEAFLVADGCGYLHRPFADRFEGSANFNDPVQARRLADYFTEVWEHAQPHPELRRLYL